MKKRHEGHNIYTYLLLKVLLAFAVLLLAQALFFVCNHHIFEIEGAKEWFSIIYGNIVFGLATVTTFLLPYLVLMLLPTNLRWKKWYHVVSEIIYILPVLVILIPRGANSAYYQYTYRLLSDEIFSYLGIGGNMGTLFPLFIRDYWYAWIFPLLIAILFFYLNPKIRLAGRNKYVNYLNVDIIGMVVSFVLVWFFMRGGFGHYLRLQDAAHYCQPKNTAIVNNDAYNILRTTFKPDITEMEYMSQTEAAMYFNPEYTSSNRPLDSTYHRRNVVLIIVESLSQEFMGCYNHSGNPTYTPFLDSLATFSTMYQGRSNGKKSIEGITAITCGIPNLMSIPLTNSTYGNDTFEGLPAMLSRHGYRTAFFHGSYNGVMDFDKTCQKIGFNEYHGKDEYCAVTPNAEADFDGAWGIFDKPFLQYTAQCLNQYKEPFFAEIFTVTSHHPFPLPKDEVDNFKGGRHPILKCVQYMDHSLQCFFESIKDQPWYNNTIFIITGDHSGHGITREYNNYDGWYRIPLLFFDPQHPVGTESQRIVQQTDLMPTIMDMLGLQEKMVCFGQSLVYNTNNGWQVYYGNGYYCMVSNNTQNPKQHDITLIEGDVEIGSAQNIAFLKSIIQQYNHRLINDQLVAQ